jgi:general stress protein 26
MNFEEAKKLFYDKLGIWKIMALATCVDNVPMIRNVSCLFYNDKIYFKTDKNFRKTAQLLANPKVAMCFHGVQVEGTAINTGLVIEEEGRVFEKLYQQYLWGSYNRYSHEDSEILIEVTPEFVEIWEDDEEKNAYQIFIDFKKEEVEVKPYD